MAENLTERLIELTLHCSDQLNRLKYLQQVLEIALEQDQEPLERRCSRLELLIDLYMPAADLCFSELEFALGQTRKLIVPEGLRGET